MICPICEKAVLFGGIKDGDKKYCSQECVEIAGINRVANQIPKEDVGKLTNYLRNNGCPVCQGKGIIDVHKSYSVYSFAIFTSWKTKEHMVCKGCAMKRQFLAMFLSSLFGWWGFPFGLIMTPVQIFNNFIALFINPGKYGPSALMTQHARQLIAVRRTENSVQPN